MDGWMDGWMDGQIDGQIDSPSTPDYITDEAEKRKINCVGGNAIRNSDKQEKKSAKQEKKEK